jgi:hypothetical protein
MLRTNKDKLPVVSVQGQVSHPKFRSPGRITIDGRLVCVQGTGGITYNAKIGDLCCGWAADHLEPGVTSKNSDSDFNAAYNTFSCVGNAAVVRSGDAKGGRGFVTGKHGGAEHVMIYFPDDVLENLSIEDKIDVKASGQGLKLLDYPEVELRSVGPELLEKMNIDEKDGVLEIGVAMIVPAHVMGSGLGAQTTTSGDYDITLHDEREAEKYGLNKLRFGDIIAIEDADTRFGRNFRGGAMTIGVIIHGDSFVAGHGPGVTTLMSCKERKIVPFIDEKANLADMFL